MGDSGTVYLISCVSEKRTVPTPAKELYTSTWFKKARHFAERTGCPWFILSAEHGLVSPDQVLAPYEKTLNTMLIAERRKWAERVSAQLNEASPQNMNPKCIEVVATLLINAIGNLDEIIN